LNQLANGHYEVSDSFIGSSHEFLDAFVSSAAHFAHLGLRLDPSLIEFGVPAFLAEPDGVYVALESAFTGEVFFPVFASLLHVGRVLEFKAFDSFVNGHFGFSLPMDSGSVSG
jgi:hypothetical protein